MLSDGLITTRVSTPSGTAADEPCTLGSCRWVGRQTTVGIIIKSTATRRTRVMLRQASSLASSLCLLMMVVSAMAAHGSPVAASKRHMGASFIPPTQGKLEGGISPRRWKRGGSVSVSVPTAAQPLPTETVPRTDGVYLRDGTFVPYGFRPRSYRAVAILLANAVLLLVARRRYLPFRRPPLKPPRLGSLTHILAVTFLVVECSLYAVSLLQLHLHAFLQPTLVAPEDLALEHSTFFDVKGVRVHALVKRAETERPKFLLHFNHGFGASSLSFEPIITNVTEVFKNTTAIAHDAPGFGLTTELEPGHARFSFYDNALLGHDVLQEVIKDEGVGYGHDSAERVFLGHSMGSLTAAFMALEHLAVTEREAREKAMNESDAVPPVSLVLVAPAIVPMRDPFKLPARGRVLRLIPAPVRRSLGWAFQGFATTAVRFLLRTLAYDGAFWTRGLTMAWGRTRGPCERTIARYRLPSLKREWDNMLAKFVLAPIKRVVAPPEEDLGMYREAVGGTGAGGDMLEAIKRRAEEGKLRVLIVHGVQDNIVPVSNSRKLASTIRGAKLVEMGCGHVPHEEESRRFVEILNEFLAEESQRS